MSSIITPTSTPIEWITSHNPVPYTEALAFMDTRVADIRTGDAPQTVWLLEHPALYTAGTSAGISELVDPDRFPVFETGRGGRYTYHGPGQRVAYVMLDLKKQGSGEGDVRAYVRNLEEWIIQTLATFDVIAGRREGRIGIWVDRPHELGVREEKIAAIGVRIRHWVSFHGISINLEPDLEHFGGIIPCGIEEFGVTSLKDLGIQVNMIDLDNALISCFNSIFR